MLWGSTSRHCLLDMVKKHMDVGFRLSKHLNCTRTASSSVLGTPPNRTRRKRLPLEELWGGCLVSWVPKWESTKNWQFHSLEPYTRPYSDTSWDTTVGSLLTLVASHGESCLSLDPSTYHGQQNYYRMNLQEKNSCNRNCNCNLSVKLVL